MTFHFVVGDHAADALKATLKTEDANQHKIIVLKDILNVGPIAKSEGESFSEMRSTFWKMVLPEHLGQPTVQDMESLLEVSKTMYENTDTQAWIWIAPLPADICAYYWLLPYLSKHQDRCFVVNIAGLPFLNDQGKIFFPKTIAELPQKEVIKALKLARKVTNAEIEVDTYEWKQLAIANTGIRVLEGGKKISNHDISFYDSILYANCNKQFTKANKIIANAIGKDNKIPTGDLFLSWRLKQMAALGQLQIQGDINKATKDFEVCINEKNDNE